jgi:hypothetical protein
LVPRVWWGAMIWEISTWQTKQASYLLECIDIHISPNCGEGYKVMHPQTIILGKEDALLLVKGPKYTKLKNEPSIKCTNSMA